MDFQLLKLVWALMFFAGAGLFWGMTLKERRRLLKGRPDAVVCLGLLAAMVPVVWYNFVPARTFVPAALLASGFALGWYYVAGKGRKRVKNVGITGTIASGKSLVGKILEEEGVVVIDTDKVYHDLLRTDDMKGAIRARFGEAVFDGGEVNRKKLGAIVFSDEAARRDLNAITHPRIRQECRRRASLVPEPKLVVQLVPLLFEAGLHKEYDEVWTVIASPQVVRERLKQRDKLSDAEVDKRLAAQFPQDEKARLSHRVIDNSGSVEETRAQVRRILAELAA